MYSHSHFHGVVLPPSLPTHCSERVSVPTHTSMVSYYHQVYSHTHSPIHVIPVNTPMVSYYHQVYSHTHQSLCSHSLPCPHTLCSPHFISPPSHYKCITNASPMHHQPSPTLSHPSCLHRIIITSSPLPITYHHQSLPLTPYNTPNPSISLPTLPIVS